MNWGTAAVVFVAAAILEQICVEILRSVFDRRRRIRNGAGGTQDIAFFGLNDLLLSAIATKDGRGYGKPNEAFKRLADR